MTTSLQDLSQQFQISGLRFDQHAGGLTRVVVSTAAASGELFLLGAHCARWQPHGQAPVLWMSQHSYFGEGKPIRGGVPICFPWFGAHSSDKSQPGHGLARLQTWDLKSACADADGSVRLVCATRIAPFDVEYAVQFGSRLTLSLTTRLPLAHDRAERFEDGLHTYFCVSEIQTISISGLESIAYLDKVGETARRPAAGSPITFNMETDRVYNHTRDTCVIHDPGLKRRIVVRKTGSMSTVVWNPWVAKSARMPDFGNDEWPGMVCIETANVGDDAVHLQPGDMHTTTAEIEVAAL